MNMRILLIFVTLLIFTSIASVSAASIYTDEDSKALAIDVKNTTETNSNKILENSISSSASKDTKKIQTVISGKIINCDNLKPFEGAKVYVKSLKGETLKTTISNSNGNYRTTFYSSESIFKVIATYPGHVYPSKTISVTKVNGIKYGVANLRLGTLDLSKGSSDIVNLGDKHAWKNNRPNFHILQIKIKNDASANANNVKAEFSWAQTNSYFRLASGENSTKNVGTIKARETVSVFFLIYIPNETDPGDRRSYNVKISGSNTGSADSISGTLVAREGVDQNRNLINITHISDENPNIGDIIRVTTKSTTSSHNFESVCPLLFYNPAILKLIKVNTTYGSVQSSNIFIENPRTNVFISVFTFEVIDNGINTFSPSYFDKNKGENDKYHYGGGDSCTITVGKADIEVNKTVNKKNPYIGDKITYTINVTNKGPITAYKVKLSDILPNGTEYITSSATKGKYNETTGIWNIGTMKNGTTVTLNITVKVTKEGKIKNCANASTTTKESNYCNNKDCVWICVKPITDIEVNKTVNNTKPNVGDEITYTITVTNNGPSTAYNVKLSDILPKGVEYISNSTRTGTYNNGLWNIGTMKNGTTVTLNITVKVTKEGPRKNYANASTTTKESNYCNNKDCVWICTKAITDIEVKKTVNNSTLMIGEEITYTINVTNNGPSEAKNVTLIDILPKGIIPVGNVTINWEDRNITDIYKESYNLGNLASGKSIILTIIAMVNKTGTITNNVTVSTITNESDYTNNNDSATIRVIGTPFRPEIDLAIFKTVNSTNLKPGETVLFNITVKNNGPNNATGVNVTEKVPIGLIIVSSNPGRGNYSNGTWEIGDLGIGEEFSLLIEAIANNTGDYTNIVNVSGNEHETDYDNNEANASLTVSDIPKTDDVLLETSKTVNIATVYVGNSVIFTITVKNIGNITAYNVTVNDILPYGLELLSYGQNYDNNSGIWTIGDLLAGESATLTMTAKTTAIGFYNNFATTYVNGSQYAVNNASVNVIVTPPVPYIPEPTPIVLPDTVEPEPTVVLNETEEPEPEVVLGETEGPTPKVTVDAGSSGVAMKSTGIPIAMLIAMILAIFGLALPRFKK